MSHFTVTVCLPPEAGASRTALDEHLNRVLEKYNENREVEPYLDEDGRKTTYNPESKWDWWLIGGRWCGYFIAKPTADSADLILGEPSWATPPKESEGVRGPDGGRVEALDLEAMRTEKGKTAEEEWNAYAMAIQGTPEPLPWSHFYDRAMGAIGAVPVSRYASVLAAENEVNRKFGMPETIDYDEIPPELMYGPDGEGDGPYWIEREQARDVLRDNDPAGFASWEAEKKQAVERAGTNWDASLSYSMTNARFDYGHQPRVKAVRESEHFKKYWDDPVGIFDHLTRDEYVQQQRDRAVPGYATISLDGEWLAPGRMGWFGASSDDETSYEVYARAVNKMIDGLPGDTVLVALDCHI